MKNLFILIVSLFMSVSSYSQGRDFKFCYGNFSVTIFDGGRAEMVRFNQSGVAINTLSGEFTLYGIGNPTELLKITYSSSSEEFRYDLIRDGNGTPSVIIDGQGRQYKLCGTSTSQTKVQSLDEMMKAAEEKRKQDKLVAENTAKELSGEMKRINSNINNPQLRKNVPKEFQEVKDNYHLYAARELFSVSDKALYEKLNLISEKIIKENLEKTGDKYGNETNSSLISYLNSNDTKIELPVECKMYKYISNGYYKIPQSKNGYVENGALYTSEKILIGKINQDKRKYFIDFLDSNNKNLRIEIKKDGDRSLLFNRGDAEVYFITMIDLNKVEDKDEWSILIKSDSPKGTSLVAALELYSQISPKLNLDSNVTQNQQTQPQIEALQASRPKLGFRVCHGTYSPGCVNTDAIAQVQRCLGLTTDRHPRGSGYFDYDLQDKLSIMGYKDGFADADVEKICEMATKKTRPSASSKDNISNQQNAITAEQQAQVSTLMGNSNPIKDDRPTTKLTDSTKSLKNKLGLSNEIEMVFVKGGTFQMGGTHFGDSPIHTVILSDYFTSKYLVTQKQWIDIMGNNPSEFNGCDDCPVENVNWFEAQEFIKKLNIKTGKSYRLPTEAEWEFAARGGNNSRGYQFSGSNNIDEVAWYELNSEGKTHPVGSLKANELGIYDMSGNVSEWCSDWEGSYENNETNPLGPSSGDSKIIRGGSYFYPPLRSRVSSRNASSPDMKGYGIRLASSSK